MRNNVITIETKELELLMDLIAESNINNDKTYNLSVKRLFKELQTAKVLFYTEMPNDVVRMNSKVTIQIANTVIKNFQIVLPEKSDLNLNKISVLSTMGLALYGYAVNNEISWQFPAGINKLKILKVE